MTRLREVLWLLGRSDSISWPVFWASLVAGTIGNFATNAQGLPLPLRVATLVLGQAALWAVLIALRFVLLRNPQRSRPVLVLAGFALAILFRVVVVAGLISATFGSQAALLGDRLIGAFLNIGPVMVATALGTSALRFRRAQIAELIRMQEDLESALLRVEQQMEKRESDATRKVQELLVTEVQRLDIADPIVSVHQLQALAKDVIRPLSHGLTRDSGAHSQEAQAKVETRVSWADMLDVDVVGRPFRPILTGIIVTLQALGAILGVPDMPVTLLAVPAFIMVVLALSNLVLEPLLARRPRRQRVSAIVAALLIVSLLAGLFVFVLIGPSPPGPAFVIAAMFSTLLSLLLTIVLITIQTRSRVAVQLEQATQQLQRLLARQRQAQWCAERSLGRALHGPLQNSVLAASSRLQAAIAAGDDPVELIRDLRDDLMQQVASLGVEASGPSSFDVAVARLQATWQGVCSITVKSEVSPSTQVTDDPITLTCLQDIVIEFVSNSVRHGGATQVDVALALDKGPFGSDIHLRARSNAGLPPGAGPDGLGTRMHDDWATSWSLAAEFHSVELTLVLPT